MSTMVTGGLGYVGRYIVAYLAEAGESVVSYNRDYADGPEDNVAYVQGELYDVPRFVDTLRRQVNFSSETAYGHVDTGGVVTEDAPLRPATPYGVTKVATELLADVYNDLYGLDVVSLRIT